MRLDEFQLAGELPSPVQRATPAIAPPAPAVANQPAAANADETANDLKELVQSTEQLPEDSPGLDLTEKLLLTILQHLPEQPVSEAGGARPSNKRDNLRKLVSEVLMNLHLLPEHIRMEISDVCRAGVQMNEDLAQRATRELSKAKGIEKAAKAYEKTVELDVKGNIAKLDADIESTAREFAKKFNLPLKWARNLIGMFSVKISYEDRKAFLQACNDGVALDVPGMIRAGEGTVDDFVTTEYPKIKEVYESVKDTLLDISLSTGQRGATGPFEAMLAIMGGCRKPSNDEGGDIVTKDGLKLEVKATSITADTKSPTSGGNTNAWLDSTAGKEVGASRLRKEANDWLRDNAPKALTNKEFQNLWSKSNFRATQLANLKESLVMLRDFSKVAAPGKKLIMYMMAQMFPATAKSKEFDFAGSCTRMLNAIGDLNVKALAKEQGIMALSEYILGKDNDGFVFFNSSTQKFKIVMGLKGVLEEAKKPESNLHFDVPMSMGNDPKASPGIYYGAKPGSPEGKAYLEKFNSSPERVALYKKVQQEKEAAKHNKDLAMIQAAKEGESTFEFEGKTFKVPAKALKKYFDPEV